MNRSLSRFSIGLLFTTSLLMALGAQARTVPISGQLDGFFADDGGFFSGLPADTVYTGSIDDVTAAGSLSGGGRTVSFTCCTLAAGGLSIQDERVLDADEAALANSLQDVFTFAAGEVYDGVDLEGDTELEGSRIEIGVSFLFPSNTFDGEDPSQFFAVDLNSSLLPLFFIFEEDSAGNELFNAGGLNTALSQVPLPAAAYLFPAGLVAGLGWMRRRQRRA